MQMDLLEEHPPELVVHQVVFLAQGNTMQLMQEDGYIFKKHFQMIM